MNTAIARLGRRLWLGVVGGGPGSLVGSVQVLGLFSVPTEPSGHIVTGPFGPQRRHPDSRTDGSDPV